MGEERGGCQGSPLWAEWDSIEGRPAEELSPQKLTDAPLSSPAKRLTALSPCMPGVSSLPGQRSRRLSLSSLQGSSPCSSCMMSFGLGKAIPTHRGKKTRWSWVSDLRGYHRTWTQLGNAMTKRVGKHARAGGGGQSFSECWEKMTKGREESWI